jgi:hypothetical protein
VSQEVDRASQNGVHIGAVVWLLLVYNAILLDNVCMLVYTANHITLGFRVEEGRSMNDKQMEKMERYFLNAPHFLWGLPCLPKQRRPLNQERAYYWLEGKAKRKGFQFKRSRSPYRTVERALLDDPGIEKMLEGVIVPAVEELFTPSQLGFLRDCWMAGTRPEMSLLTHHNIDNPYPFLVVNQQFKFVERWGEFAGLWFEEIEGMDAERKQ